MSKGLAAAASRSKVASAAWCWRVVSDRKRLLALLVGIGISAHAPSAEACTCADPEGRVLLPSATRLAPADGPWLVLRPAGGETSLRTELSEPLVVKTVRSYEPLSACATGLDLVRPESPLDEGEFYMLFVSWDGGGHSRRFKATREAPKQVERSLLVKLERGVDDHVLSDAMCAHPMLKGKHAKGYFALSTHTDAPALLFVELSAADTSFGQLVAGGASLAGGMASETALSTSAEVSLPELDTTAACARVVVRDALDAVVYDQELCPEPGQSLESTETVSIPEHLVREASEPEDDGCGCRAPRTRPLGLGAFLLLGLGLLGRRRRTGTRPRTRGPVPSAGRDEMS